MNTVHRAPSSFVGLFNLFPTRTSSSQLLRSSDVTPTPVVQVPDATPVPDVSPRAEVSNIIVDDVSEPTEQKPVSESDGPDLLHTRRGGKVHAAPRSALWAARRIQEDKPEMAIAILRNWVHNRRSREATHEMLATLNGMDDDKVVQALSELKQPYLYVRSAGRREQTLLPVVLHTREFPRRDIAVQALLDSGCTGSCIDKDS